MCLHDRAEGVDDTAIRKDVEEVKRQCSKYELYMIFRVDETELSFRLLLRRAHMPSCRKIIEV